MTDVTLLIVVWSFWGLLTLAMIRAGRSWFPFTIVVPFVLSVFGIVVNRWLLPWGTVIIVGIHAGLWLLLIWMWLRDRLAARGGADKGPREEWHFLKF